ncbi:FAD-binding oxidoreductase [Vibrio sp. B1FLJ16]|uniref:FAD-binding oxidoreductase n=1 Tax=Vibrio sp. B1FLJ16 TaxID=2751178 RepID=UPI0015F45217|nr:FAD-binding oxidoreductase [Vibrio sp. B1FLJ16]CAD7807188.1 Fad linked oxidase [Vibrio sp. B1FLJ16]CAE6905057.1 Fad linked oxidase [Vibrio sp. B1FLJ16]
MDTKQSSLEVMNQLAHLEWVKVPIHVKRLSKDFHWFSPVLAEQLAGKVADVIVKPKSLEELKELISKCVELDAPVTVRGGGTGNYGQSVPLCGGIVIDMTKYASLVNFDEGVATVEPGLKISELEGKAKEHGYEMRCMPSTYKMATVGGLFSGGFGGVGSINYGPLAASGTILGIKVLTIEPEPKIIELSGAEILNYHHTYGTNGIVVELEIALAPKRHWDEYMLAFANLESAYQAAYSLAYSSGIDKRNVALFSYDSAKYLPNGEQLNSGEYLVIAIVASNGRKPLQGLLKEHDGRIAWNQQYTEMTEQSETMIESCWNHSTLHALKHDKSLTYLQANYDVTRVVEQLKEIESHARGEVTIHLEFILNAMKQPMIAGLPLIQYSTPERLEALIDLHRHSEISINNPHVFTLEDGKHAGLLSEDILKSKRENDPKGLLNRGKIRSLADVL